ncbi:hypothetical protein [Amphibacillus indicireducens]|uniref:Uncharacterized protein n=1 Tax=Amphibacillus indicireducens TaxID=1076330 RepID=A0ABP7V5T6_9BACI
MGKEITNEAIFLAVNELAQYVSQVDKRLSVRIDSLDERLSGRIDTLDERLNSRMDALETRIETMDKDIKQEFSKVNEKIDVVDTQLVILSGGLTKTQAEVKVLQNAK